MEYVSLLHRVRVIEKILLPLPFTLLDQVLCSALMAEDVLSNRVNPLPPGEGRNDGLIWLLIAAGRDMEEAKTCNRRRLTIAIDGPSGAGKSTVGKSLAKRLGYIYIDTGAMYRAVALKAKEKSIVPEDEKGLYRLASSLQIIFVTKGEETHVLCDGEDVTEAIRSPEISAPLRSAPLLKNN